MELLSVIIYDKYEKADFHKVLETQCKHLTMTQSTELLKLLQISEVLFNGKIGTFLVKRGWEANMLATITSNEGT